MTSFFFSSGSHKFRPSLNFLSFCLNLLSAEITYIFHHAQLAQSFFEDYGMGQHVRQGKVSSVLSLRDPKGIERRMLPYQSPALPPIQKLILIFLGYYGQTTFCREPPPDKAVECCFGSVSI